jgi:glucan phosphoethanolaminetransferase (alkaline phosphatase superfamily)
MATYRDWESRWLKYLEDWKVYIRRESRSYFTSGIFSGLIIGILIVFVLIWGILKEYPEMSGLVSTLSLVIIVIFISLIIDMFVNLIVYHKNMSERDKFFRELNELLKGYVNTLEKTKKERGICSGCGYELEGNPKFCPECGNKLV